MNTQGLLNIPGLIATSLVSSGEVQFGAVHQPENDMLIVSGPTEALQQFEGSAMQHADRPLLWCPLTPRNMESLRQHLSWLIPHPLGTQTSVGMGDRLGLATPGHVRAIRAVHGTVAPIFAQQSIREMRRTQRTPRQVMDDAVWGVFTEGWHGGFGADADHLKTTDDIDLCANVGFTFFTIDPSEHVDNTSQTTDAAGLKAKFEQLPWDQLEDTPADLRQRYLTNTFTIENHVIQFTEETLVKAAVKYGRAIAHIVLMYRHLAAQPIASEMEISVDETDVPTSHAEHIYIVNELQRLQVQWISLAPRYIGVFEKGVDYIGDLGAFEEDFAIHAAIARQFGGYKLSLHSGSDKFSIYPITMQHTQGLVHLKTAGTSYLEALRTIASLDSSLFQEIYTFARERYEEDRASYHVSARLEKAPFPVSPNELSHLLEQYDAREILHVTFGSVLTAENGKRFKEKLMRLLRTNPESYAENLERHFYRHILPFSK